LVAIIVGLLIIVVGSSIVVGLHPFIGGLLIIVVDLIITNVGVLTTERYARRFVRMVFRQVY
jgi:hypothetical protein